MNKNLLVSKTRTNAQIAGWTLLAGSSAMLLSLGCGVGGDRSTTGMCPTGETCSAATPNGLRFYGPGLGGTLDSAPHPTVIGGMQTIRFEDHRGAARLLPEHTATSDTPSVLEIVSSGNGEARVRGRSDGSARLRIADQNNQLLDRIALDSRQLARVDSAPPLLITDARPLAYAPGTQRVHAALFSSANERLVDESLTFGASAARYSVTAGTWDTIDIEMPATDVTVAVATGAGPFTLTLRAAGPIDDIALNDLWLAEADRSPLTVSPGGALCFDPLSRGATIIGSTAVPIFRVDGVQITTESFCVALPPVLGATTTVEVSIGGVTRTFTARVDANRDNGMSLTDSSPYAFLPRNHGAIGDRAGRMFGLQSVVVGL